MNLGFLVTVALAATLCAGCKSGMLRLAENQSASEQVRAFMESVASGDLRPPPGHVPGEIRAVSGWKMTTERGKQYPRWKLNDQVAYLTPIGPDAVPELLRWLNHGQMEMRYIAAHSLKEISGEHPFFPTFATLQELREKGWLFKAVAVWQEWYDQHQKQRIKDLAHRHSPAP
jgi:hypothetical protein